ncbi:hypothetical protein UCRPC4_g03189 [Phaeomoniella chlamydospora]|uniref:DUF7053 domain-containing protein n=1 Tax=Phaeomoniella chlamydospora TaxID=158046 RepID=A0A0G2EIK9_PHACM|nr:hypothetical protein UCRPC4_g03189 [Phaeomoniella chlamydospora]
MLHDHAKLIELNPLVIDYQPTKPPEEAPPDEFHCVWYEVTDRISWLPGVKGSLKFHVCFNDIPLGVQTHVYAPMGLDIQEKWSIGGNLPGEPREPRELGITVPRDVLYLREDVNMNVSRIFTNYTKTKLNKAHTTLVERLLLKGEIIEDVNYKNAMLDTISQNAHFGLLIGKDQGGYSDTFKNLCDETIQGQKWVHRSQIKAFPKQFHIYLTNSSKAAHADLVSKSSMMASNTAGLNLELNDLTLEVQSKPIFEPESEPSSPEYPTMRQNSSTSNNKGDNIQQARSEVAKAPDLEDTEDIT